MPGEKYELYGKPRPPADPNAEYMDIQETAFVLHISVSKARRLVNSTGLCSRPGRAIVTNKADRAGLYEAMHQGGQPVHRRPRRRTPTKRTPAGKKDAATALRPAA